MLDEAVTGAARGDTEGFHHLYLAVQPRLLSYLRSVVGETDAEDVASETWTRIAQDLHTFTGTGSDFRAWATVIARYRAIDHLRRGRHAAPVAPHALPDRPSADDTARDALDTLSTTAALALLTRLPPSQAHAVLLRVVIGLDTKTAAEILGKKPNAVHAAQHRGLRRLAQLLEAPAAEPAPRRVARTPR